jgi:hypothetical protein
MKKNCFLVILLLLAVNSYSQSKAIIGSWLSLDKVNKIHFFINTDGTIEKRTATKDEDIWSKTPSTGTFTFQKNRSLVIKWNDKKVENIEVKFVDNNAEFRFLDPKDKTNKSQVFLRIVDEEIIQDK